MNRSKLRPVAFVALLLALPFTPAIAAAEGQGPAASAGGLSEGVMLRLARTPYIAAGDLQSPDIVYVFVDTECPWCHRLMQRLARTQAGVQVRYVLVAVLQEVSLPHAAVILDSKDRAGALARLADGKPLPAGAGSSASRQAIATNNLLMQALELPATPGLVYRDAGGHIRAKAGMPDEAEFTTLFRPASPAPPRASPQ